MVSEVNEQTHRLMASDYAALDTRNTRGGTGALPVFVLLKANEILS